MRSEAKNVLGTELQPCCFDPMTGYMRDGYCHNDHTDRGRHWVCAQVDETFLAFSKSRGNDLSTPAPYYHFPGLKPGDRWCLCAQRWQEALEAGVAPKVVLHSTHHRALEFIEMESLLEHALDNPAQSWDIR